MKYTALVLNLALAGSLAAGLTGCGSSSAASAAGSGSSSGSAPMSSGTTSGGSPKHAGKGTRVTSIVADKTAQVLLASSSPSSTSHEATFVVTAYTRSGKPAAHKPVAFYIGPMVPLSNVPPSTWYKSGTSGASKYIASYSKMTNAQGQATVVLYGQPAKTMEMIGVSVGNLSSYSKKAMHAVGSLDAWWTTPSTTPGAPVGESVTVKPWVSVEKPNHKITLQVTVSNQSGPVSGAGVDFSVKKPGGHSGGMGSSSGSGSGSGMGSSSGSGSSMSGGGTVVATSSSGMASYTLTTGKKKSVVPVRIVVNTAPGATARLSGGMNVELFSR